MKIFLKSVFWLPFFFPFYLLKINFDFLRLNMLELFVLFYFAVFSIYFFRKIASECLSYEIFVKLCVDFFKKHYIFISFSFSYFLVAILSFFIVPEKILLIDDSTVFESRIIALGILKGWILVPYLFFLMLYFLVNNLEDLNALLIAYLLSCSPLVIWAFYQVFSGDFITLDGRASGPFVNANYLAMYLSPAIVILWRYVIKEVIGDLRPFIFVMKVFLSLFFVLALMFTHSYVAIIATIFASLFYLFFAYYDAKKMERQKEQKNLALFAWFFAVVSFVVVISAISLFLNTEKFRTFFDFYDRSSSAVRLEVYQISWQFIKESPLLGIGLSSYEALYNIRAPQILGRAPFEWVMIHPHNTFLAFWLNLGFLGLLLFISTIVLLFHRWISSDVYEVREFRLLSVSMMLVMLLHGFVDTYFFKNDLSMLMFMVLALGFLPLNKQKFVE